MLVKNEHDFVGENAPVLVRDAGDKLWIGQ
jgi:hypothetical protein